MGRTRCLITQVAPAASADPGEVGDAGDVLSPREQEIARMVGRGYTNKEIARVLEISSWTVSAHLRRVFSKLNVTTRAAMVATILTHAEPTPPDSAPEPERRHAEDRWRPLSAAG